MGTGLGVLKEIPPERYILDDFVKNQVVHIELGFFSFFSFFL